MLLKNMGMSIDGSITQPGSSLHPWCWIIDSWNRCISLAIVEPRRGEMALPRNTAWKTGKANSTPLLYPVASTNGMKIRSHGFYEAR